jgi:hypothetical protein
MLLNAVLVAAAAAVVSLGIHAFTQKHLRFLDLALIWHGGEWHLGAVCWVASCMGGLAVLVPPLLQKTYSANFAALGYVPSSGESVVTCLSHVLTCCRFQQPQHWSAAPIVDTWLRDVHVALVGYRWLRADA